MATNIVQPRQINVATQVVTSSNLVSGNGDATLAGGLSFRWGQFAAPSGGAVTVTFDAPFLNNCFVVVPSQGQSTSYGYPFSVASKSVNGFVTDGAAAGGIQAGTCYYLAIGN